MINLTQQEAMTLIVQQEQAIRALEMSVAGFVQRERQLVNTIGIYKKRVIAFADAWSGAGVLAMALSVKVNAAADALVELSTLAKTGNNT